MSANKSAINEFRGFKICNPCTYIIEVAAGKLRVTALCCMKEWGVKINICKRRTNEHWLLQISLLKKLVCPLRPRQILTAKIHLIPPSRAGANRRSSNVGFEKSERGCAQNSILSPLTSIPVVQLWSFSPLLSLGPQNPDRKGERISTLTMLLHLLW